MLQDALTLDPKNMLILSRLGSVYYTYGLLDHAAYYWQQAVDINPNSPELVDVKTFLSNRL
jgi:Tfp pilus assembly protein PilF